MGTGNCRRAGRQETKQAGGCSVLEYASARLDASRHSLSRPCFTCRSTCRTLASTARACSRSAAVSGRATSRPAASSRSSALCSCCSPAAGRERGGRHAGEGGCERRQSSGWRRQGASGAAWSGSGKAGRQAAGTRAGGKGPPRASGAKSRCMSRNAPLMPYMQRCCGRREGSRRGGQGTPCGSAFDCAAPLQPRCVPATALLERPQPPPPHHARQQGGLQRRRLVDRAVQNIVEGQGGHAAGPARRRRHAVQTGGAQQRSSGPLALTCAAVCMCCASPTAPAALAGPPQGLPLPAPGPHTTIPHPAARHILRRMNRWGGCESASRYSTPSPRALRQQSTRCTGLGGR